MNDTTTGAGATGASDGAAQAQPQPGNTTGPTSLTLPPIFDRMQRYVEQRPSVRAAKIVGTTPGEGKTTLHFHGGYFPSVEVDHAPIPEGADVNHYLVIEENGRHHVLPAELFEQHFKLV